MTVDETTATRRSVHSIVPLLRNAPTQPLFEAIEDQHLSLLNVLDIVHCIGVGVADGDERPTPEIAAAFELLEREIQRIAAALQKISLRGAIKARSGSRHFRVLRK